MEAKNISIKYPKAYSVFLNWSNNEEVNLRDLYDFFDENDLFIEVSAQAINKWSYDIFKLTEDNFECILSSNKYNYINRIEAESEAFYDAFEIMENKL